MNIEITENIYALLQRRKAAVDEAAATAARAEIAYRAANGRVLEQQQALNEIITAFALDAGMEDGTEVSESKWAKDGDTYRLEITEKGECQSTTI